MKTRLWLLPACLAGLLSCTIARPAEPPAEEPAAVRTHAPAPPPEEAAPPEEPPAADAAAPAEEQPVAEAAPEAAAPSAEPASGSAKPVATAPRPAPESPRTSGTTAAPAARLVPEGSRELRLNFRNAPLDLVLNYLSEAAGFIIDLQTEVRGRVDVWSNQPLTREEAVDVLNSVLNRNGYAAIRNGRTLTIVSRDEAKKRDIPVRRSGKPEEIEKGDEIVTQIIPVRFINATQLIKDLQPLLPSQTTMTANEGGNSLVITDTQTNIRRMAEIVQALDTAISSTSAIRVFPLKYADAKTLSTVVKDLFQTQDSAQQRGGAAAMQQFFRGMRGGGPGGDAAAGPSTSSGGSRVSTPRVVSTADERSNALVVSAPEDQMVVIEDLVRQVDVNVEDITELRVFRLRFADPQETADMLTELFPDTTTTSGSRGQVQFGGRFGGGFGGRGGTTAATDQSSRLQKQSRVIAVPDLRTGSVVVSAAHDLMDQIAGMLEALDSDPARKQKVHVFSVENTDPQAVQTIIEELFPAPTTANSSMNRSRSSTSQQVGNQLNSRASTRQSQSGSTSSGRSSSNFGGSTGGTGR